MAIRELASQVMAAPVLAPAVRTNGTVNGTSTDLRGFDSVTLLVHFGAYTDGTHTASVEHSVDGSVWAAVAATDLLGAFVAANNSGFANTTQQVGYMGDRRFVRVVMVTSGATSGAASSAMALRGHPHRAP